MVGLTKFFAGSNTALGFHSFFDHIVSDQAKRVFILKGGPGTGKSTLIKRIAQAMVERGFVVEQFHCSSDADSLDAVSIPSLRAAIIDGTAPHVVDPRYPGAIDEIVNLGQFWDTDMLAAHRQEVIRLTEANKQCYQHVYNYLEAAAVVYEDSRVAVGQYVDRGKVSQVATNLVRETLGNSSNGGQPGRERHLFASAISPQGMVNELESIVQPFPRRYILKGDPGTGKSLVMAKVFQQAVEAGLEAWAFHCALVPERIEHVVIPRLKLAMITSSPPHLFEDDQATVVNLNECLDKKARPETTGHLQENEIIMESLFDRALAFLRKAKSIHDELESYYVDNVDFSLVESTQKRILERLLAAS